MRRRHLLALAGVAAASATAAPARAQKVPRVGVLFAADPEPVWTMFRKAMADLGYVEGRNVIYEVRVAGSGRDDLDALAASILASNVDVIVPVLSPAITAVKARAPAIPIVFSGGAPNIGLVSNLARPEGNMTGVFGPSPGLAGKGLQLFRELRPGLKMFGLLLNASDPFHIPLRQEVEAVARAEGIETVRAELPSRNELAQAVEAMAARGVDGVLVQPSLGLKAAAALALKNRLPGISFRREFVEDGGLLSYGADQAEIHRGVAAYVDRILKGANPADLPVVQSAKVELVVNQKTARLLGVTLPPMFLARVDEVIE